MSFYIDDQQQKKVYQPAKLMAILLVIALTLGMILVVVQLVGAIVNWWRKPRMEKWPQQITKAELSADSFLNFEEQFAQLLVPAPELINEEEMVTLKLDDGLLSAATQSASANRRWFLELNIDGEWNRINNFYGWKSLLTVRPETWHYLIVYQADSENIVGYDLLTLEEKPILSLAEVGRMLEANGLGANLALPLDRIELMGIVDDQLYVYVRNPLNEGVMMYADYGDFAEWTIWQEVKGRVARANGQSFLIQGFEDGCSAVATFDKISGVEKQLERLATTYNGCVAGDRFLGVDGQGRILLAEVKNSSGLSGVNLDIRGEYVDLQAIPINNSKDRVRLLLDQDLPSGIYQAVFFPGTEVASEANLAETNLENESSENVEANGKVENDETNAEEKAAEDWRKHDQIVMVNSDGVWSLDLMTHQLQRMANLMSLFGKPIIKSWEKETLCLEMIDKPDLSIKDRMISIDLETGVPVAGTEICLRQGASAQPYVNSGASKDEREEVMAAELELPEDFRLVYENKVKMELESGRSGVEMVGL